ncbi:hypothetical protein [Agrobacterium pusense]|uniref:hypothetical protein n=1 Tax=Agrobacterium pusense TaxID=648995 RepID=UPI00244D58A4|nr:hypothetical protein [Agrobacterium pusense]MDH0872810.1 hypothetical protein [Agrobacterium pusense]MDH1270119.1 hypothetical protein [Agrobacterium pusense]
MSSNTTAEIFDAHIAPSTVGFLLLRGKDRVPYGSGTLVKTSTTQGILTCGHVVKELRKEETFGVCLFPVRKNSYQALTLPVNLTAAIAISYYEKECWAPDIAFIPIPLDDFSSLASKGNVYDLDFGQEKYGREKATRLGVDVMAGVVWEMTPPSSESESRVVQGVEGLMTVGRGSNIDPENGWDRILFTPEPSSENSLPLSYGGTSGGGVWEVFVTEDGDEKKFFEKRLSGVAYCQQPGEDRTVICHGPVSIYGKLLAEIKNRYGG